MTAFAVPALCLPAAAGFLAPALWAWKPGWKPALVGHAALLVVMVAWGLIAGASGSILLALAGLSTAFALFALGLHLVSGQVVSGLIVIALNSTLFFTPPVVLQARETDVAQARLDALLSVNPWTSIAGRELGIDLLRDLKSMYRTGVADYVTARPPAWPGLAAGFALGGIFLGGAAFAVRRMRRAPA